MTTLENKIKATILLENSWGLPIVRHVWLRKYDLVKEQYGWRKKVKAIFTFKGESKVVGFRYDKAVIVKGWKEVEAFNTCGNDFTSCDNDRFKTIASNLKDVIVSNVN